MRPAFTNYLAALLLCLNSLPLLAEPASKTQASYDVIGLGMTLANISETFTRTQDSYRIESVTRAVGFLASIKPETIRVTSQGRITPQGLIPLSYSLMREVDTHKNTSAKFNWETAVLTHSSHRGLNDLPLAQGTQDRLSVLYHLPLLAKSDQTEFKFSISDGNKLEAYSFNLAPNERDVTVPLGTYKTRYVTSSPIAEEVKYEIWMAIERDNFPCKIIVTDSKGGKLTQVLTQLKITP